MFQKFFPSDGNSWHQLELVCKPTDRPWEKCGYTQGSYESTPVVAGTNVPKKEKGRQKRFCLRTKFRPFLGRQKKTWLRTFLAGHCQPFANSPPLVILRLEMRLDKHPTHLLALSCDYASARPCFPASRGGEKAESIQPIGTNGSQRGGPPVQPRFTLAITICPFANSSSLSHKRKLKDNSVKNNQICYPLCKFVRHPGKGER